MNLTAAPKYISHVLNGLGGILLFFIIINPLKSQQQLSGLITDAFAGEPLAFCHIFLLNEQAHGVISNELGAYQIQLTEEQQKDTLAISLLGYKTQLIPLASLKGDVLNLRMERSFFALQEIVVTSDLGLRNIINKAIERIPQNYGTTQYMLQGYYREYSISDTAHSFIMEGMINYQDEAYDQPKRRSKAWVTQLRASDNYRHPRFRSNGPDDLNRQLRFYEFYNTVRQHQLHWLGTMLDNDKFALRLTNRGEYVEGKDTLIRIEYGLDLNVHRVDSLVYQEVSNFFEGEVLINKTDYAFLRNTVGSSQENYYLDLVYRKRGNKYFPHRMQHIHGFRHNAGAHYHATNTLLFFYDVLTDKQAIRQARKGKRLIYEVPIDPNKFVLDVNFWANNQIMQQVPVPKALAADLSRTKSLEQQYRDNARKVVED